MLACLCTRIRVAGHGSAWDNHPSDKPTVPILLIAHLPRAYSFLCVCPPLPPLDENFESQPTRESGLKSLSIKAGEGGGSRAEQLHR